MSELDVLRGAIDEVDRQIVALFERRMAVTQQVGEYKQAHDIPVLDAHRERQVIANKLDCLQNQDLRTDVTLPASRWRIPAWSIRESRALTAKWPA